MFVCPVPGDDDESLSELRLWGGAPLLALPICAPSDISVCPVAGGDEAWPEVPFWTGVASWPEAFVAGMSACEAPLLAYRQKARAANKKPTTVIAMIATCRNLGIVFGLRGVSSTGCQSLCSGGLGGGLERSPPLIIIPFPSDYSLLLDTLRLWTRWSKADSAL